MYITFDYRCPDCGHEESRFVKKAAMNQQWCNQPPRTTCSRLMTRLPAGTRTTFRFADPKLKR